MGFEPLHLKMRRILGVARAIEAEEYLNLRARPKIKDPAKANVQKSVAAARQAGTHGCGHSQADGPAADSGEQCWAS
jgi:hypothetical protein